MSLPYDLDGVRAAPGMYFVKPEFHTVAAYIEGLNAANQDGLLVGFREWLVPRVNGGANLVWSGLILRLAFPGSADPDRELGRSADHTKAIECMFANLEDFWAERSRRSGLRAVYLRFQAWLERQDWYGPESFDWIDTAALRQF